MSAIWGFISLENNKDKLDSRLDTCMGHMTNPYKECQIDRFEVRRFNNGFFSCGIQYFTEEAQFEVLPIVDQERNIVFASDIVLNARGELICEIRGLMQEAAIKHNAELIFDNGIVKVSDSLETWPDGALAYLAYTLWGENFVDHIQGLFAIAIYDLKRKVFRLFSDHMGCRCIYYSICGNELFFSSLCRPIIEVIPADYYGINEKWIAGSEYTNTPSMILFPGLTPFENIYQLTRGYMLEVQAGDGCFISTQREYYNPAVNTEQRSVLDVPTDDMDQYYRNTFRSVFSDCVIDAMRCKGNVAATISSGLDSTSVAAVAASYLAKQNKKLYGFTSIPLEDYVNDLEAGYVPDESDGVKYFCSVYRNIDQTFTRCEGKSAFTEMDRLIHIFEVPGKAFVNQVWVMDIVNRMKEKNCTVMLNGQYGNFTISNGNAFSRMFQELYSGHIGEAKKQLAALGKRYGIPRKVLFSTAFGEMLNKLLFDVNLDRNYNNSFDNYYLKKELLHKHRIKQTEKKLYKKRGYNDCEPRYKQDNLVMDETITATMGIFDTKISLYYGVLFRDPTRDKRIVELCIALPNSAFTDDGVERRLVRDYLDDLVPDGIRNDPGHRGVQSPDAALRLRKYGAQRKNIEIDSRLFEYMNEGNVRKLLKEEITEDNHKDIVRILALDGFLKEF